MEESGDGTAVDEEAMDVGGGIQGEENKEEGVVPLVVDNVGDASWRVMTREGRSREIQ